MALVEYMQSLAASLGLGVVQPEVDIAKGHTTATKNLGPNIFPFFSGLLPHMTLSDRARICTDTLWAYISMLFALAVVSMILIIMLYVCPAFESRFIQFLHKARSFWAEISGQKMAIPSEIRRNIVSKRVADQNDSHKSSNSQVKKIIVFSVKIYISRDPSPKNKNKRECNCNRLECRLKS